MGELLDCLKQSDDGRLIVVSSETHRNSILDLQDLMVSDLPDDVAPFMAYGRSKLANILFAKHISRKLDTLSNFSVYSLCPGFIKTGLGRYRAATQEDREKSEKMFEGAA